MLVDCTVAFIVCFAICMMSAVIGIRLGTSLGLNETRFGVLVATSVLTGSPAVRALLHRDAAASPLVQ